MAPLDEAFEALYRARYGRSRGEIIADWLSDVPRDARILEIGANVGNQLRALQRAGFERLMGYKKKLAGDAWEGVVYFVKKAIEIEYGLYGSR